MAYLSQGSSAQFVELKVQELIVTNLDTSVLTVSGSTVTIDVGQDINALYPAGTPSVTCALFIDDSAGTVAPVKASNQAISGSTVTLTLSAPFADHDAIRLCFEVIN